LHTTKKHAEREIETLIPCRRRDSWPVRVLKITGESDPRVFLPFVKIDGFDKPISKIEMKLYTSEIVQIVFNGKIAIHM
jgi:hypothetical protein